VPLPISDRSIQTRDLSDAGEDERHDMFSNFLRAVATRIGNTNAMLGRRGYIYRLITGTNVKNHLSPIDLLNNLSGKGFSKGDDKIGILSRSNNFVFCLTGLGNKFSANPAVIFFTMGNERVRDNHNNLEGHSIPFLIVGKSKQSKEMGYFSSSILIAPLGQNASQIPHPLQ